MFATLRVESRTRPLRLPGNSRWQLPSLLVGILALVVFRILWGHSYLTAGLPLYSIDENDVVEPAAGFLMGDWNHQYYTYGPAFMYLLSLLYAAAAPLQGQSIYLFATSVFFEPYWHYYLARLLSLIIILGILAIAVIETQRLFSFLSAALCLLLLAFPIPENFTRYTARIDVLQALFQLLALFSLIRIFDTGAPRHYVLAGLWIGLAIASKPIPGALIVPIALGVTFLRLCREKVPSLSRARFLDRGFALIAYFVTDRRIYLATLVAVGALFVGFPFAVLDFGNFWSHQISRIQSDSTAPYPRGFSTIHYVPQVGWFLCALGVLALLYQFLRGSAGARILASFASFYLLAFSQVPARDYFFITILAPIGICIALLLTDLIHRFPQPQIRVILVVALVILILFTLPQPRWSPRAAQLAVRGWIIENIPNGARLCYAGWHTNGPRLVSSELDSEAQNDYFMYGRDQNQKYLDGFAEAHRRYALSGRPLYNIANWGRRGAGTPEERAQLLEFCRVHGSNYLVLGGIPPFGSLSDPLISGGGISVFKL